MAKFCSGCGAKLEDSAKFCSFCGVKCAMPQQPMPQQPMPQAYAPPPAPPQAAPPLTLKQQTLRNAPIALNRPEQPWYVTAEGDALVARWKWSDGLHFPPHEVTREVQSFTFTVTLSDNGTWRELDNSEKKSVGLTFNNGSLGFGGSSSSFSGKQNKKSFSLGVQPDGQLAASKFDTTLVKQPIREYLTACGWKKAGR